MSTEQPPLVAHIIYALGTGGLENGLVNIINRCPPQRYRHAIICLTGATDFAERITARGVTVYQLHKRPGTDFGMYRRLWSLLRRLQPAIVHSRNLAALETQALGLLLRQPRRIHGEHGRDIYDLDGSNPRYRRLRRLLDPLLTAYIAVSQDLAGWLTADLGIASSRVHQIYNGVDSLRFHPRPQATRQALRQALWPAAPDCLFGTVGRLAEVKNQRLLLAAMAALAKKRPALAARCGLVIAGDGPLRAALKAEAQALGVAGRVWFAGDRDDVDAVLGSLDVFLLPSLAEGISNTVLEAMASGLPVIASQVGGNPELVEDGVTGRLFASDDLQGLVAAMIALAEDDGARQSMGRAARARIERDFDWDRTVAQYLRVYDRALEGV